MKRAMPWSNEVILSSDESSDSDAEIKDGHDETKPCNAILVTQPAKEITSEGDDSMTNPFEERGNDVNQHEALHVPVGPITRVKVKCLKDALNGLVSRLLDDHSTFLKALKNVNFDGGIMHCIQGVTSSEARQGAVSWPHFWCCDPGVVVIRRAEMYQEYMRQIPIPSLHGSSIPFTTWQGLAKSIKQLYGQPLHYLTNVLMKQWDQSRIGTDNEHQPLDTIMHPCKAEATIWLIEQVHRLTTSHHHLAKLWQLDPMHHAFVDPIFPKI